MADPEQLDILRSGVARWNLWRRRHLKSGRPDLSMAELSGADLWGANLSGADLTQAQLSSSDISRAQLSNTDLSGSDLAGVDLSDSLLIEADLSGARLAGANLHRTRLLGADLSDADLSDADFSRARLQNTRFHSLDLSLTRGLTSVDHQAPSSINFQTLMVSQGKIPEGFLKRCELEGTGGAAARRAGRGVVVGRGRGLPDWLIFAAKLLDPNLHQEEIIDITYKIADLRTLAPIAPLSVFVSYTHEDHDFVRKLEGRLDKDGIRFWRDVHHMIAGPLERQIDRAISIHGAVLLILSKASVDSDWVKWEARKAREVEQKLQAESDGERHYRLCPVALDDSWKDCLWPGPLRTQIEEYNILDFSMWRTDEVSFEAQYEKLKAGLGIYYRK